MNYFTVWGKQGQCLHSEVVGLTGTFSYRPTHWKQTLFMLDKPVDVSTGDSITGRITMRRNSIWRRHMTITLNWNVKNDTDRNCQARSVRMRTKLFLVTVHLPLMALRIRPMFYDIRSFIHSFIVF